MCGYQFIIFNKNGEKKIWNKKENEFVIRIKLFYVYKTNLTWLKLSKIPFGWSEIHVLS